MSEEILDVEMPVEPEPAPDSPRVKIDETENETKTIDREVVEEEKEIIELDRREIIPNDEVFRDAPKVQKVKRKCSDKQLAHLKKIREKALMKKREQKEWADAQKDKQRRIVDAERRKAPPKKQRPKKVRPPSPQYEEEEEWEQPQHHQEPEIFHKLTAYEIRAIQRDAISDYETQRLEKKHHKRLLWEQKQEEDKQRQAIASMNQKDDDPWSSAFNFQ